MLADKPNSKLKAPCAGADNRFTGFQPLQGFGKMIQFTPFEDDQRNRHVLEAPQGPRHGNTVEMTKPCALGTKPARRWDFAEGCGIKPSLKFVDDFVRHCARKLRKHFALQELAMIFLHHLRQIERRSTANPTNNTNGQSHDEQGGQTSKRDHLPSAEESRHAALRSQSRFHFFPKRRSGLADAQDSEKA